MLTIKCLLEISRYILLAAIHQRRPVKRGCVKQSGRPQTVGGGRGAGHKPDVHKRKKMCISESVSESDTQPPLPPPARPRTSGLQQILRFGRLHPIQSARQ